MLHILEYFIRLGLTKPYLTILAAKDLYLDAKDLYLDAKDLYSTKM